MIARLLAVVAIAASAHAQAAPFDSTIALLMHHDSTSQLTLTARSVIYEYTQKGVAEETRRADSATARYSDPWIAGIVRESIVGAFQGLRAPIPLVDIASAEVDGATIRITSAARPRGNADESTFEFDADDAGAAQVFVKKLNVLLHPR